MQLEFLDTLSIILICAGFPFFLSGTVGLLRFPDIYSRLHAITKADNVGLGLIISGLILDADSFYTVIRLVLIWILVLISSSASCHLIARSALQRKIKPWVNSE